MKNRKSVGPLKLGVRFGVGLKFSFLPTPGTVPTGETPREGCQHWTRGVVGHGEIYLGVKGLQGEVKEMDVGDFHHAPSHNACLLITASFLPCGIPDDV